jgi:signal transduction histidine kinase
MFSFHACDAGFKGVGARLNGGNVEAGPAGQEAGGGALNSGPIPRRSWLANPRAYVLCAALAITVFVADVILPRGATAAIAYCIIPPIAAATRRRGFVFGMTITCTLLTWAGYFLEPAGAVWWMSVFDRVMVAGALWLALFLAWRRVVIIKTLLRQRQELEDTTRELERFASVVAHDLRGPLNTVGLLTQVLSSYSSVSDDAEFGECIGAIRAQLTHMSDFIQRLLAYGRIGSGDVGMAACDCMAVLTGVRQTLKADLERNCVQVTNDPLPMLRADPVLMAELFQNLIENSIKYRSEASPRIHVSAARQPDGWLFSVQDNGIGIRAEDSKRIFEPFHQVSDSGSPGDGVGLGLATCKRVVERHGGRIEVQSKHGEGTTFLFTIPQSLVPAKMSIGMQSRAG